MAGRAVRGGRHPAHGAADPRGDRRGAAAPTRARLVAEARAQGTTTLEIKSGYGLTVADEERALRLARDAHRRDHVPRRPRRARRVRRRPGRLRRPRRGRDARRVRAPRAVDRRVHATTGAFTVDEARRILEAGARCRARPARARRPARRRRGSRPRRRARRRERRPLHVPDRRRRRRARRLSDTVATLLPGVEFSTRQPYPDARRLLDAGVAVAIATDCNPGSSFSTSMPLCHRARGARDGDDPARGARGGDGGRGSRAAARRRRAPARGRGGGVVVLDAPTSTCTWRTGPGCRSCARSWAGCGSGAFGERGGTLAPSDLRRLRRALYFAASERTTRQPGAGTAPGAVAVEARNGLHSRRHARVAAMLSPVADSSSSTRRAIVRGSLPGSA